MAAASIDGVDVRLVIDSGGESLTLKAEALRRVGAQPRGREKPGTNVLGETRDQATFRIGAFELGGRTFHGLDAVEAGAYATGSPGDGVIGRDFLNAYVAIYDYPGRTVSLFSPRERQAAAKQCSGYALRTAKDPERLIVSTATTEHSTLRVLWDTGAQFSFVKQSFADAHKLPVEQPFYTAQRLQMDGRDFGPLKFVVFPAEQPANIDAFIGSNFFETHVVCIDAPRGIIRIRP